MPSHVSDRLIRKALRRLRSAGAGIARLWRGLVRSRGEPVAPPAEAPAAPEQEAAPAAREEVPAPAAPVEPRPEPGPGAFIAGSHACEFGERDYKLFLPPGHEGRALPLVVMLHGCMQDPDDFALGTGMNEHARAQGFFVLYPAQSPGANATRCWNWFKRENQQRGRGEPALLAGMTREVMQRHGIDPHRVYVAGLSAGGSMAAILGHAYADLYAAVGVHSGLARGAAFDAASAFSAMNDGEPIELLWADKLHRNAGDAPELDYGAPAIVFHGDDDATVHPQNAQHVVTASVSAAGPPAAAYTEAGVSALGVAYTRSVYQAAGGASLAEHWVVHGVDHAWSGGSATGSYTDPRGPDATREMLRFFFEHALAQAPAQEG